MDKAQALHNFWSGFSWLAIDEQSAYDEKSAETLDGTDRYITYEVLTGNLGDALQLSASLWHRSTSWETITKKADEIANYIGYGGVMLKVDGGLLWVKLGQPFAQRMAPSEYADASFDTRRILLNIEVDYLTAT